ncbi:unnamed protein product [Bursaphelenchus xylophilus]|uniref:(pine wood nematode) hypothetical protein n=1 Tax=Bursaphelenchus xylophilus TaxID=6326 RepID=A0A1I7SR67_BURXY|nr:unnamed protein product [Bursaphelenchus xylophilus]CAG9110904.1 unnamed protein product [Bursaphelenchus xylophilus]
MRSILLLGLLVLSAFAAKHPLSRFKDFGRKTEDSFEEESDEEYDFGDEERATEVEPVIVCRADGKDPCHCDKNKGIINCRKLATQKGKDVHGGQLQVAAIKTEDDDFKAKYIVMANNRITYLDGETITPGQRLTVEAFDFTYNQIAVINPQTFDNFPKLEKLRLSYNFLKLDSTMDGWITDKLGDSLKKLYLDYNSIDKIEDGVFDPLKKLETLVLDGNPQLKLTDKTFGKEMASLKELSLDHCKFTTLPDKLFDNLKSLESISLIGNHFVSIPSALGNVAKLTYIDLSKNELTEIPEDSFKKNPELQALFLNDNKYLSKVDDCGLCGLKELKKVILNKNPQLYHIHKNAFGYAEGDGPKALETLLLDHSNFSTLDKDTAPWDKLDQLALGGNPWNCNDDLDWLLKTPGLHLTGEEVPRCQAPSDLAGKSIIKLRGDAGVSSDSDSSFFASAFFALLGLIAISGIVVGGFVLWTRRPSNPFYRPTMPNVGFSNLTTELDMEDEVMSLAEEADLDEPKPTPV